MNNLHDRLERACDVLDDIGDHEARDAVIEAGKLLGELETHKEITKRMAHLNTKLHKIIDEQNEKQYLLRHHLRKYPSVGLYNNVEDFITAYHEWIDELREGYLNVK